MGLDKTGDEQRLWAELRRMDRFNKWPPPKRKKIEKDLEDAWRYYRAWKYIEYCEEWGVEHELDDDIRSPFIF